MANFLSLQMTPPTYPVSGPGSGGRSVKVERGSYTLTAAASVNDTIQLFKLHPRFRVTGGYVKGNLGTGVTLNVGDAGSATRYFSGVAAANGTPVTAVASTGLDYITTAYTPVFATITGATTAATGDLVVVLEGIIEEPA